MRKTVLRNTLIAVAGISFIAGNAFALPFNSNRPISINSGAGSEDSLQTVVNTFLDDDTAVDVAVDQSSSAIWGPSDGNASAYVINLLTGNDGKLGIYSYTDPTKWYTFDVGGKEINGDVNYGVSSNFSIFADGSLVVNFNGTESTFDAKIDDFGSSFGFYWDKDGWDDEADRYYTEDSRNNNQARALAYQLDGGLDFLWTSPFTVDGFTPSIDGETQGGDDWILAFEDGVDNDYQDAVFYIEDMSPVPEPTTMLLFGTGLVGLAGIARRRNNKK